MVNKAVCFFTVLLILFTPAVASCDDVWLRDGEQEAADTPNVKVVDNFGVQLWVVEPIDFPQDTNLKARKRVKRGELVSTALLFINPGVDEKAKCDIVYDVMVKRPDGKTIIDLKDLEVRQNKPAAPRNMIQIAGNNLNLKFEQDDPT